MRFTHIVEGHCFTQVHGFKGFSHLKGMPSLAIRRLLFDQAAGHNGLAKFTYKNAQYTSFNSSNCPLCLVSFSFQARNRDMKHTNYYRGSYEVLTRFCGSLTLPKLSRSLTSEVVLVES